MGDLVWTLHVCPECHGHGPATVMCCHGSVYDPPRSSTERGGVRALAREPIEVVAKERSDYTHERDMQHIREVEEERERLLHGICDALDPDKPTEPILRALLHGTEHEHHHPRPGPGDLRPITSST